MKRRRTKQTGQVLLALFERFDDEHYGLDLMKRTGLSSGTMYVALSRLEEDGFIKGRWKDNDPGQEGRPRRRMYQLTGSGMDLAQSYLADGLTLTGRLYAS